MADEIGSAGARRARRTGRGRREGLLLGVLLPLLLPSALPAQPVAGRTAIGAHFGLSGGGDYGEPIEERLGVQLLVPAGGGIELGASVAWFLADARPDGRGSRSILSLRFRPRGPGTFLSVGGGVTIARLSRDEERPGLPDAWWETALQVLAGVEVPVGRLRPFVDGHLFLRGGSIGALALTGLNFAF